MTKLGLNYRGVIRLSIRIALFRILLKITKMEMDFKLGFYKTSLPTILEREERKRETTAQTRP